MEPFEDVDAAGPSEQEPIEGAEGRKAHVKELAPLELGGPLFEQCRARKNKKPTVGMEDHSIHNASVSLLWSSLGKHAVACSLEQTTLVNFASNGDAVLSCCDAAKTTCSGCAEIAGSSCISCAGGFRKGPDGCIACRDIPGFVDPSGHTCADYVAQGICQDGSKNPSDFNANIAAHVAMADYKYNGLSAVDACCACGGGLQTSTPFTYSANLRSFVLGATMKDQPHPRTASSYRVAGVLEGSGCDLHSIGLSLNAETGEISGTPTAEEPVEVECVIQAVQDESKGLIENSSVKISLQHFAYAGKLLPFPTDSPYLPRTSSSTYSNWRVACTPHAPWLTIDQQTGALTSSNIGAPDAAFCTVTAYNGTADLTLPLPVVVPRQWTAMDLRQVIAEDKKVSVGSVLDLVAGRAVPPVAVASADGSDHLTPPVVFYAACDAGGEHVSFDMTTGDVLVRGHVAFRLEMLSGEFTGIPDIGVLGSCGASSRCKVQLQCTIFGELAYQPPGSLPKFLKHSITVVIRDDTCWQHVSGPEKTWTRLWQLEGSGTCRSRCRASAGCSAYQEEEDGEPLSSFADNNFNDRGSTDDKDTSKIYEYTLSNGYKCSLSGWTHTRDYQSGYLRNVDGSGMAVVSGLEPGVLYAWKIYQKSTNSRYAGTNPLRVNGESFGSTTAWASADATKTGFTRATAAGEISFEFVRKTSHVTVSGIAMGKAPSCFSVRSVASESCPEACFCDGEKMCKGWCAQAGTCETSAPAWGLDCRGCGVAEFSSAWVRIRDCDAQSNCLSVSKKGGGAAFLDGVYCPASDGEKDGLLPYYAKPGEVQEATLYLSPWQPSRETQHGCPTGTGWVIRRASSLDFFQGEYVELRGDVLACFHSLGHSGSKSWSIGDAVLDEVKSDFQLTILDASYVANRAQAAPVDEVHMVPVARTCTNPLEERRATKKKGEKDELTSEEAFTFDDPDAPSGLGHFYSLNPCECFSGAFGANPPVTETTFSMMPPGSDNDFVPSSTLLVSGSLSCEPQYLMLSLVGVGATGCETACRSGDYDTATEACAFYFTGSYTDVTVCRLYSSCGSLVQEVNSHGELFGVVKTRACLIADPESCKPIKREKWLADGADTSGQCLFEDLISQCDASLIHGGNGISECGHCTHMLLSEHAVQLSRMKRPLPSLFQSGSMISVGCDDRYAGLNRYGNDVLPSQKIICQDGEWVDPKGGPGLSALQCVACVRTTPGSKSNSIMDFVGASQQERWWLQRHSVEIRSWNDLCLASDSEQTQHAEIKFTDNTDLPPHVVSPSHRRRRRAYTDESYRRRFVDSGEKYGRVGWKSGFLYGWRGTNQDCQFDQRTQVSDGLKTGWYINGNCRRRRRACSHEKFEDVPSVVQSIRYTLSFKARVVADYATGWNWPWHYSSSACAQDRCLVSVNCPSGQTMVQCEAAPTFGASTASGGARVSGSSCQATGGKLGANIQQGSWKEGNKDSWTSWASCPSGTVAVTPAGLYAGNTFGGYDTAYYLKLMGDRRRRLSYQTKLCPAGQFMKYIKTCAGGRWDSMDYVQCTSGHRIDSSMKQGCDQRRRRRRVEVHAHVQYNNIAGTRKVTGQEQGNADKVCFEGGTCRGNTNSDSYSETCGDRGLLAGWREYDRRRSVQWICRELKPVVKSFECSSSGCKAECANDKCQIRPNCIQASSSQVTDGPSRKSSGANQWTAWSECPSGYKAAGLRYMQIDGDIRGGRSPGGSVHQIDCSSTGCRAMSRGQRITVKAACVQHAEVTAGNLIDKNLGSGYTSKSTCPSGFNPIGIRNLDSTELYDAVRKWHCDSSGCMVECNGVGRCKVRALCLSAMTRARVRCSTSHKSLVIKSSTGPDSRSAPACPATHQTVRCLCISDSGKCSSSNGVAGDSSCTVDFGRRRRRRRRTLETVSRMCLQGEAKLRVSLGTESTEFQDFRHDYISKTVQFTAKESGSVRLKFEERLRRNARLFFEDVSITDSESDLGKQSLMIDPSNVCAGSRWEIEMPATDAGTPYQVTITYGDSRRAVDTSTCTIGTEGRMKDASHPDGTIAQNKFATVTKPVIIYGSGGKGKLAFSGELSAGCSGINKISISKQDSVFWSSCGAAFSKAWSLEASRQAPGNVQLVYRDRQTAACVDPMTGKMQDCALETDVEAHTKQVFSLDYLAPLAARWTHMASGQNLQPGACVRAQDRYLPYLKVNQPLVSCAAGQVLSSFSFRQDSSCNGADYFRYFYSCTTIVPVKGASMCTPKTTRCVAHSGSHPHLWELDRHDVGSQCEAGTLLTKFEYKSCTGDDGAGYHYAYTCCPVQGLGECSEETTEWGEVGEKSDLAALAHHRPQCPRDSGLQRFLLESKVPEVAQGATLQGEVRYTFVCCMLPMAPPVSVKTGPLDAGGAWEGTYCPAGRSEGRATLMRGKASSPYFSKRDGVSCGYHKDKLAKIVDGGAYMPSTRAGALSTCGPVCAAEPSCDGFIWIDGMCGFRKDTSYNVASDARADCHSKVPESEAMKIKFDRLAGHWCMISHIQQPSVPQLMYRIHFSSLREEKVISTTPQFCQWTQSLRATGPWKWHTTRWPKAS